MLEAKYITYDNGIHSTAIIFSCSSNHANIARALNLVKMVQDAAGFVRYELDLIIGAGFIGWDLNGLPYAYGQSSSLGIQSSDQDTSLLIETLGLTQKLRQASKLELQEA